MGPFRPKLVFVALFAMAALLVGCGNFFVDNNNTPGANGHFLFLADANDVRAFSIGTNAALTQNGTTSFSGTATAIGADANGHLVYVSTSSGVAAFQIDRTHGTAATINGSPFSSGFSFSWVAVDPSARFVFAASGASLFSYTVNSVGALTLVGSSTVLTSTVQKLIVDPSGRFLFVADGSSGVAVLAISSNGTLGAPAYFTSTNCTSAFAVAVEPTFHFAYVVDGGTDICLFSLNSSTGAMTELAGSPRTTGSGAIAVKAERTGHFVFVVNKTIATVTAYVIQSDGTLTIAGTGIAAGTVPVELDADPQSQFLFVVDNAGSLKGFSISSSGVIGPSGSTATGTAPVGVVATP
jgi:6-phosphogluconolactonase (cycloisomerase 2 family)